MKFGARGVVPACLALAACGAPAAPPPHEAPVPTAAASCAPCTAPGPSAAVRSEEVEALASARVAAARAHAEAARGGVPNGLTSSAAMLAAIRDVAFAARDGGLHGEALLVPLREYRAAAATGVELAQSRMQRGSMSQVDVLAFKAQLAEAEFWLAEATASR